MTTLCSLGTRFARKGDASAFQTLPWLDAFQRQHAYDAHVTTYTADARRAKEQEPEVVCHFGFLDYDESSDHLDIFTRLADCSDDSPAGQWAVAHPTKSGARFVFRFDRPVPAAEYGAIVRGVALDLWKLTQMRVDPTTDQWTRMFRLPCVVRDDEKSKGPTWEQPYYFDALVDAERVLEVAKVRPYHGRLPWDTRGGRADAPLSAPGFDEMLPPDRHKIYKHAFNRNRFRVYLFEDASPPEGRRDQTLLALAGEVVRVAFQTVPDSTAEEIYLFLRPIADRMAPDGSEEWSTKLWRMVSHSWNGETKKERDRASKTEAERSLREALVERMLTAVPGNQPPNDPVERMAFARRHYCLQTSSGAYVVQRDGTYSMTPVKTSQIPAHFNDGLAYLDDNGFRNESGKLLSGQEVLNEFSTIITDVEFLAGAEPGARLRIHGHRRVLEVVPFSLRRDLVDSAEFDPEIGEWLDSFQDSSKLKRWLASALALPQGPTAALYLHGPARVGKSLICQAIAECFDTQPATGAQAFSDFNGALMTSPVVMVDEGLPTRMTGMDTADLFRSLVTGGPVGVQKKYMDSMNSRIPYRVIFAANSFDMVRNLIGRRTMEITDREAFRERILVIETGRRPADYLDSRGAMNFTKHSPKGSWLGGSCRLARHLIKLYQTMFEQETFSRDGRLLVEGENHPAFMLAFDLGGFGHELVDELVGDIARLSDKKINGSDLPKAMRIEGASVWIKKRPYIKLLAQRLPKMRTNSASTALDRFTTGRTKNDTLDMSQMVELDIDKLLFCARSEGLAVASLEALRLRGSS